MKEEDRLYVLSKILGEGFDYAFWDYGSYEHIKDEKFHELRNAYLKARKELNDYLNEKE